VQIDAQLSENAIKSQCHADCCRHEVVKGGEDKTFVDVRLLRYWQMELMDGREVGSLCQQFSIISQSPEA